MIFPLGVCKKQTMRRNESTATRTLLICGEYQTNKGRRSFMFSLREVITVNGAMWLSTFCKDFLTGSAPSANTCNNTKHRKIKTHISIVITLTPRSSFKHKLTNTQYLAAVVFIHQNLILQISIKHQALQSHSKSNVPGQLKGVLCSFS